MYILIPGEPITGKRARSVSGHARPYDPQKKEKTAVRAIIQKQMAEKKEKPFTKGMPLKIWANFVYARPASHYGTGKNKAVLKKNAPRYKTSAPDIDNLLKFIKDCCKDIVWHDDSQVVEYGGVMKAYSSAKDISSTFTVIVIEAIDDDIN